MALPAPDVLFHGALTAYLAGAAAGLAWHRRPSEGDPVYLILRSPVSDAGDGFPSLAAEFPTVNWLEREIQDWFGLTAVGHPNPRRVTRICSW